MSVIHIIGSGLGGLTLARILQLRGRKFRLYDRDKSLNVHQQGGALDLRPETGQRALRVANLYEQWKKTARSEEEATKVYDKKGRLFYSEEGGRGYKPEIDRGQLRDILWNGLQADTLRWDHKLKSIERSDQSNQGYALRFENGQNVIAERVVGADGAWSSVRSFLSPTSSTPVYSGISFFDMVIRDFSKKSNTLQNLVGVGHVVALDDCKAIFGQQNFDDTIRIYAAIPLPMNPPSEVKVLKPAQLIEQFYSDWCAEMKDLLLACDASSARFRPIYALPVDFHWSSQPGVTLLGDAAHLMSPFAGEGANLALADATDLAEALTASTGNEIKLIQEYEKLMMERARNAAEESAENLKLFFSKDAVKKVTNLFSSHHALAD